MVVSYTYNQLGQVVGVGNGSSSNYYASYDYNPDGSVNDEYLNNYGSMTSYSYNGRGFPTQITNPKAFTENISYSSGDGSTTYYNGSIYSESCTYSQGGPSPYSYTFQYNWVNRMISAKNSADSAYNYGITSPLIAYDNNGNITQRSEGSDVFSFGYSGSNIPASYTKQGVNYTLYHDPDGNITGSYLNGTGNFITSTYDPFTLMTMSMSPSGGGSVPVSYQYDGRKERIIKTVNGTQTLYLRGTSDYPIEQQAGSATRFYVYGPTGLLAVIDNGVSYFVVKDHLGSVRSVLNQYNNPITWYDYTPYGNMWRSTVNGEDVAYKFTGQEFDPELGLYNFRARIYDGTLGIFYASDPAGQGFSPYMYCGGNPVMYRDKDGRTFGIDDLIISGLSFIEGYVQYGLSTHHWGGAALGNGLITVAIAEGAYLTGGAIAGSLTKGLTPAMGGATAHLIGSTIGGGVAGTMSNWFHGDPAGSGWWGGFAGGLVQGWIPGANGAFLGGFASGMVGTMAENGRGVLRNGLIGGALSLVDYDIEAAIKHTNPTGDPRLDKNRQALQDMWDYQQSGMHEAGAGFYKNGDISYINYSTTEYSSNGYTTEEVVIPSGTESSIHTHPVGSQPSGWDAITSSGSDYIIGAENIVNHNGYNILRSWNTSNYLMVNYFSLFYFGRR
jgi:RHS repeat-associated protein